MPEVRIMREGALPYLLSVPPGPAPRPVLCFLHGYGEAAPMAMPRALTLHGPLRADREAHAVRDFIVVAPQLPRAGDLWAEAHVPVQEIVAEVQALYGGDPRRTYLTGFSFGGNGVFDLALAKREPWAALWAVDPTRLPVSDPGLPVWLSVGAVARPRARHYIDALRLVPADAHPAGQRLYADTGHDHVGSAAQAYADERIYRWLLGHSRVPEARQFW